MAEFPTEVTEMVEELLDGVRKNNDNITSLISNAVKDWATQNQLSTKQVKMLGDTVEKTSKITKQLGKGMQGLVKDLNSSTAEFTQLNGIVGSVGGVFTNLLNSIPLVGDFFGAVNDAAVQGLQMSISQTQQAFNAFQKLGKAGLIGEEGISGFVQEIKKSNIPMQDMQKMLVENSKNLAYIGGSALEGGKLFTNVIFQMQQGIGEPLRMLGYDIDDIGEAVVQFSTRQRKLGDWQEYDAIILAEKTRDYIKELDIISKLTGVSAEALRKDIDEQLRDSRFAATIRKMQREGRHEEAEELQKLVAVLKERGLTTVVRGIKDLASDYVVTGEAVKVKLSGFGSSIDAVKKGHMSAAETLESLIATAGKYDRAQEQMALYMGDQTPFIPYWENIELSSWNLKEASDKESEAREKQKNQLEDETGSTKKLVEAHMMLQKTVSRLNVAFGDSVVAVGVVNTFATALDKATMKITKMLDELSSVKEEKLKNQLEKEYHYNKRIKKLDENISSIKGDLAGIDQEIDVINKREPSSPEIAEKIDRHKQLSAELKKIERERTDIVEKQSKAQKEITKTIRESKSTWEKWVDRVSASNSVLNAFVNPTMGLPYLIGNIVKTRKEKKEEEEEKAEGIKIPGFLEWATKPFAPFIPGLRSKPKEEEESIKSGAVPLQPHAAMAKQLDVSERSILSMAGLNKEVRDLKERLVMGDIDRVEYNNQMSALTEQGRQALTLANIKQSTGGASIARPEVSTTGEMQSTATGTTGKTVPGTTSSTPLSVTQTPSANESAEVAKDRQTKKDILDQSKRQLATMEQLSKKQDASTGILEDIRRGFWDLVKTIQAKGN